MILQVNTILDMVFIVLFAKAPTTEFVDTDRGKLVAHYPALLSSAATNKG